MRSAASPEGASSENFRRRAKGVTQEMDREIRRRVEEYRHTEAGPIENNLIDELVGGDLDR